MNDKPEIVKLLLDRGADINSTVSDVSKHRCVTCQLGIRWFDRLFAVNGVRILLPRMTLNILSVGEIPLMQGS
jgi:hypothetical protein